MSRLRGLQSKLSTLIFAGGWLVKQFCIIRLCLDDPVQKSLAPLYLLSGEVWDFSIRDSIFWYEKKREHWGTLAKTNENTSRSNYCWLVRKLRWKKKHDVLGYLKVMLVRMDSSKNHLTWMFRGSEQVFHGMLPTSFKDEHMKNIFRKPETLFFICICQDQIKVLTFTDSQTSPSLLSSISPCIKPLCSDEA